jgi:pilus assembly protein CpaF
VTELERRIHQALATTTGDAVPSIGRIESAVRREAPLAAEHVVLGAVGDIRSRLLGLGPIDVLLGDPTVSDVLVNGPGPVWVERSGQLEPSSLILDRAEVDLLVERIVAPVGRRADPVHPIADARLVDGSRAHIVVPPLAVDGPYVSIRRFGVRDLGLEDLADPAVARLLAARVRDRANIVVSGGTGSGKTTLLNALAAHVHGGDRIVTVEDAAELRLAAEHVVRLEARPAALDGAPEVSIRDLVRAALRMRPDRLIVGEVRGGEVADLLTAMTTGHDGSLTTVHANGAAHALGRLELLVQASGLELPVEAVRQHLGAAIDLVVHVERSPDGRRRVVEVDEPALPAVPAASRRLADGDGVVAAPRRRTEGARGAAGTRPPGARR